MSYFEAGKTPEPKALDVRVALYQHTYVNLSELSPALSLISYENTGFKFNEMFILAKAVFAVDGRWMDETNVTDYTVENIPGGLLARGKVKDTPFTLEAYPIILPRDEGKTRGGMAVRFTCQGEKTLRLGAGTLLNTWAASQGDLRFGLNMPQGSVARAAKDGVLLQNSHPYIDLLCAPDATIENGCAVLTCKEDVFTFCVTFAENEQDLLYLDAKNQIAKVKQHYDNIFSHWKVETPEQDINDAFAFARDTLEQTWFYPLGWVESCHHWLAFWHVEHTAAEEWAGNDDRTRAVISSLFDKLIDEECVPEFCYSGDTRIEWGGEAPYMMRNIEHYLKMTGDKEFAAYALPYLERIMARALKDYDPVDSGVPAFGTQLGNQEDFDATPGMGGASASEFANMHNVMGLVCELCGQEDKATLHYAQAQRIVEQNYRKMWMKDVGRFAWFEDTSGNRREDPAYHALCYPVLYNQISDYEAVSSVDHMQRRLTGPKGEVYQSNHFGGHAEYGVATWGMQAGANNQMVPAMTLARLGKRDEAIRPLRFVADVTCNRHRGAFPETNAEAFKSYFSPAACVYAQGIIEGIFGLDRDMIQNTTTIAPCLPSAWDRAAITLPGINLQFTQKDNTFSVQGRIEDATQKRLLLRLDPCTVKGVTVNGEAATATLTPRCGWFEVSVDLGTADSFTASVSIEPIKTDITTPECTSVGDAISIQAALPIVAVRDVCGVFSTVSTDKNRLTATLKKDLLDNYKKYGDAGLINFARRMFVVTLQKDELTFDMPVFVTVLPKYYTHCAYSKGVLTVNIIHGAASTGTLLLGRSRALVAKVQDNTLTFALDDAARALVTPGRNTAQLLLDGYCHDIAFISDETAELEYIALDKEQLTSPADWRKFGWGTVPESTIHWATPDNILCDVFEQYTELSHGGLTFKLSDGVIAACNNENQSFTGSLAPDRYHNGLQPWKEYPKTVSVSLKGYSARKVYLLLACFITNQHPFSTPFTVELDLKRTTEYIAPKITMPLSFPGDIDIGLSGHGMYGFPSYVDEEHCKRGLPLPWPKAGDTDYPDAMPPEYPQHYLWNMRPAFEVNETVFSIVEIPLGSPRELERLQITVNDSLAGIALYAITLAK